MSGSPMSTPSWLYLVEETKVGDTRFNYKMIFDSDSYGVTIAKNAEKVYTIKISLLDDI